MPRTLELELDDANELVAGKVPPEIDQILKRIETTAHGAGYGKGVAKAAEDAKKQIEDTVKAKIAEFEARQPLERERFEGIENENKTLKGQLTDRIRDGDRVLRAREEAHAEELTKRVADIEKRNTRIKSLDKARIRGLAVEAGAREESLGELEVILGASIGYDDDMEAFVRGEDGHPMTQHGKPVSLGTFVKSYIDSHAHHRKPAAGRGGDARRGASLSGGSTSTTVEAARARIDGGDRSAAALNELFEASRKKAG